MRKSAIILFLMGYCAFFWSQNLQFSRPFQAIKSNVPVSIINSRSGCFYVLRYNKAVHDFTIEKRAKPSAEIVGFTPLKLDSVNNSWFDYERLDYLFFEQQNHLYFLFEKVVNLKKTLYLKVIDSLSKSSGFIELASLESDKLLRDFSFSFKRTGNHHILIVASQYYFNGTVKKVAQLYDLESRRMVWAKKLPLENNISGYSSGFECNAQGDLFYIRIRSHVIGYARKYTEQLQPQNAPVFFYDAVNLLSYRNTGEATLQEIPLLTNVTKLGSIALLPQENEVLVQANVSILGADSSQADLYFFSKKLSVDLSQLYYTTMTPLAEPLKKKLTFYDGSDLKNAGDKEYVFLNQFTDETASYQITQRREGYYYKELLVWQTDLQTGQVRYQGIIPRKVLSFKNRTRFKNVGEAMFVFTADKLNFLVLEAPANFKSKPSDFDYHLFKKETNLWRSNIIMYTLSNGTLEKKLVYHNSEFDMVPLNYSSLNPTDVVFYLSSGKYEKFAILQLNPS